MKIEVLILLAEMAAAAWGLMTETYPASLLGCAIGLILGITLLR